jgi:hypothetical protein
VRSALRTISSPSAMALSPLISVSIAEESSLPFRASMSEGLCWCWAFCVSFWTDDRRLFFSSAGPMKDGGLWCLPRARRSGTCPRARDTGVVREGMPSTVGCWVCEGNLTGRVGPLARQAVRVGLLLARDTGRGTSREHRHPLRHRLLRVLGRSRTPRDRWRWERFASHFARGQSRFRGVGRQRQEDVKFEIS